ncbi:MAG: hypothetical protein II399_01630 [Lachnospiraceae bacterium]|nr:hypothetical protein [Lachnospiraceae bacterium]
MSKSFYKHSKEVDDAKFHMSSTKKDAFEHIESLTGGWDLRDAMQFDELRNIITELNALPNDILDNRANELSHALWFIKEQVYPRPDQDTVRKTVINAIKGARDGLKSTQLEEVLLADSTDSAFNIRIICEQGWDCEQKRYVAPLTPLHEKTSEELEAIMIICLHADSIDYFDQSSILDAVSGIHGEKEMETLKMYGLRHKDADDREMMAVCRSIIDRASEKMTQGELYDTVCGDIAESRAQRDEGAR